MFRDKERQPTTCLEIRKDSQQHV